MATKATAEAKAEAVKANEEDNKYWTEKVTIHLFKDSGKYKECRRSPASVSGAGSADR